MTETVKIELLGDEELIDEVHSSLGKEGQLHLSSPRRLSPDHVTRAPIDLGSAIEAAKLVVVLILKQANAEGF